jgi:hypothetical protein
MISYINVNVLKQQQISTQMEDLTNSEDIGVKPVLLWYRFWRYQVVLGIRFLFILRVGIILFLISNF